MRYLKNRLTLLFVACAFAASGCSPQEQPHTPNAVEPSLGTLAPVASVASVTLPLDTYGLSPEQKLLDTQASDLLIRQCMNKAGEQWQGSGMATSLAIQGELEAQRLSRFGPVDEAVAAQYGYNGKPVPEVGKEIASSSSHARCAKEVKIKMGEGAPPAQEFGLLFGLPEEAAARTANDSRYLEMIKRWVSCMSAKGYKFTSPQDASTDSRWPTDKATTKEAQTAVADVKCKQEVNYLSLVVALRTAYENQLIEENSEVLGRLKEYYDRRVKLIADLLSAK